MKKITIIVLFSMMFSSFGLAQSKLTDEQKKLIEDNTPTALPQSPVAPKLTTDAEDENLRGKVKTVVVEDEYLTGSLAYQGRHYNFIFDYNERGNRIKRVYFSSQNLPVEVTVFGYIDGMRVLKSETIQYGQSLVTTKLDKEDNQNATKPDLRYDSKLEYKYADGKLVEAKWLGNDGSLLSAFIYKGNQMEDLIYSTPEN